MMIVSQIQIVNKRKCLIDKRDKRSKSSKRDMTRGERDTLLGLHRPLVLQCMFCRTIVGDTSCLVDINIQEGTITSLSNRIVVVERDSIRTALTPHDYASTFHRLFCPICSTIIGKMYKSSSKQLDHLRDRFTFILEYLFFYELLSVNGAIDRPFDQTAISQLKLINTSDMASNEQQ